MKSVLLKTIFGQDSGDQLRKEAKKYVTPSSTYQLYKTISQKNLGEFTVPAFNLRTLTFDMAKALFRAAKKEKVGAFIIEIARSEIGYTSQTPWEYSTCVLSAAREEEYTGPLWLQGDHFKIKPKKYFSDKRSSEIKKLKSLIRKAVKAEFYNIDIDCSKLTQRKVEDYYEQQKYNAQETAKLTEFIRRIEPPDKKISIGGEVGEIGGKNTTPEELEAFMSTYQKHFPSDMEGLIKLAVQTGTSHGGRVLPSGELAEPEEDFKTLEKLSKLAREEYGMGGVVQHGASTLPESHFHRFPENQTLEIHLATSFQNIIYDSQYFPAFLKEKIYSWLKENFEQKEEETDQQFFYRKRKRALGPFKKEIWNISQKNIDSIAEELEEKFRFLFRKLKVSDSKEIIEEIY